MTDWDRFLRVVRRHRVEGLVHEGLTAAAAPLPAPAREALAVRAAGLARRNLVMARETGRLQRSLDEAGVPNLVLKGATLSALAYQNRPVKTAWDIDFLTDPASVPIALAVLQRAGYGLHAPAPALTASQLGAYIAVGRELVLLRAEGRIFVEVKWSLDQNPGLLPALSARSAAQTVTLADGSVARTLGKDSLFAYLCVHGVRRGFARLKWLADLAALLALETGAEIERLYRASQRLGAHRCPAAALLLCADVLGLPLEPALREELAADRAARRLAAASLQTLAGGDGEAELSARPLATTRLLLAHLLMGRDAATWRAEARLKWISARDRMDMPLPPWAGFVYPLVRAPRFLWRRAAGAMGSGPGLIRPPRGPSRSPRSDA